ncbi:MAG: T9SS type A sorting domain-containing protein, partial [Bacteroidia bacterium]
FEGITVEGAGTMQPQMNYYRSWYDPTNSTFTDFDGYNPAHGILIMQNSTIKRVLRYKKSAAPTAPWHGGTAIESKNGGILDLYNNRFENNWRDMYIHDFERNPLSVNTPNQFNLINCDFIKEPDNDQVIEDNDADKVLYYVWLENVRSVQIEGCYFENNFDVTDSDSRKEGIVVYDASFYLQKSGFSRSQGSLSSGDDRWGNTTACPTYNLPFARVNKFENLTYGITTCSNLPSSSFCPSPIDEGIGDNTVGISDCLFLNCKNGVFLTTNPANFYKLSIKVTCVRNVYYLHDPSLFGDLWDFSFFKLKSIQEFIVSENAVEVSVPLQTGPSGQQLSGTELSGILIEITGAKTPTGEIYRNNQAITMDYTIGTTQYSTTFNGGFQCTGNRTKDFPTKAIYLHKEPSSNNGSEQNIYIGCNEFKKIDQPIIISKYLWLIKQGNGASANDHSKSSENNFTQCNQPYIKWNRASIHVTADNKIEYLYDETDPDPTNIQTDILSKSIADDYDCGPIGCSQWPIRYIDLELGLQNENVNNVFIYYSKESNSLTVQLEKEIQKMSLYDMNGRLLTHSQQIQTKEGVSILNLNSKLSKGVYVARLEIDNGQFITKKIVISE